MDFQKKCDSFFQLLNVATRQNWLLGAGISASAHIPLMSQLTKRICELVESTSDAEGRQILTAVRLDLSENSHVEHYLSHLGDLIAIAERTRSRSARIGAHLRTVAQLRQIYGEIITAIGNTVRYGYKPATPEDECVPVAGTAVDPIIDITAHDRFVKALLMQQSNLERRSKLTFFTTNYDTLLEDALSLNKRRVCDGFSGGAVAFWNNRNEFAQASLDNNAVQLCKLHGSVDWYRDERFGLVRSRYGTNYLHELANIMIYPQATKYIETQKDPFASLFMEFRDTLMHIQQNTLICCGYSFGDEHINSEIEHALRSEGNQTTLIVFIKENETEGVTVSPCLDEWLSCKDIGSRIYVAGENGIYNGSLIPCRENDTETYSWWRFSEMTRFLETGII